MLDYVFTGVLWGNQPCVTRTQEEDDVQPCVLQAFSWGFIKVKRRVTFTCPTNESVILPGTFWHNTICGNPEHYKVQDLFTDIHSKHFLDTLKELTTTWVRDIPNGIVGTLCRDMTGYAQLTQRMFNFDFFLHGMGLPAESLYYRLNKLSFYHTSKQLYDTLVKPFVTGEDVKPELAIHFLNNPLWIGEHDMLLVETKLTIP